jgi:RHS repeat-associated protein
VRRGRFLSRRRVCASLASASDTRDALDRVVEREERVLSGDPVTSRYEYDERGRLVSVTTNGVVSESYAYDANGNRLGGEYDAQDRQLAFGSATYAYDLNGSMTNRNGAALEWNLFGRLLSVGDVFYRRDEQQRLCYKSVGYALPKNWFWSGSRIVAERDYAKNAVSYFVYAGATAPAYMVRNGVTYRIITDNQGSVRLVVDEETGDVAHRLDYDSFGRVLRDTNPGFQPFGFQGGLYDPDTGLVEFGCRWYDAETGRWISKDPIGLIGGVNLYEFCKSNPILYIDPSGKNCITDWWEDNVVQPTADGILAHWNRNRGRNEPANLPKSMDEAIKAKWIQLGDDESIYHRLYGAIGNVKFVSPDGLLEAVYDMNGVLVTDVYNLGTYNYYNPKTNPILHGVFDVAPYLIYGNSPEDFVNPWPRISATWDYLFHSTNKETDK